MNHLRVKSASLLALLAAGCYPLEQAPLVYTSRQQMGVHVAGGTPDNPGLELSIGYKSIDAALVPVAVAKHCTELTPGQCEELTYQLIKILGSNDVAGASSVDPARVAQAEAEISRQLTEVTHAQDHLNVAKSRLGDLDRQQDQLEAYRSQKKTLEDAQAAGTALNEEEQATLARVGTEITQLQQAETKRPELSAAVKSAQADLTASEERLTEARHRLTQLQERRSESNQDVKHDALSVFGSFEGDAKAGKESASLGVGKVFSTGVASQHLTQGLGRGAVLTLRAKCIETVVRIATDMQDPAKKNLLENVGTMCMEVGGGSQP